jgi:hypothetical protein
MGYGEYGSFNHMDVSWAAHHLRWRREVGPGASEWEHADLYLVSCEDAELERALKAGSAGESARRAPFPPAAEGRAGGKGSATS